MSMDFRLPHITGGTVQQQLDQIVAYLRQTALLLQAMPEQEAAQSLPDSRERSCIFPTLQVQGSLNGVYSRRIPTATGSIRLRRSRNGTVQSFFLWGHSADLPVQGLLMAQGDTWSWTGTQGVTVTPATGWVEIRLSRQGEGWLVIQSADPFTLSDEIRS